MPTRVLDRGGVMPPVRGRSRSESNRLRNEAARLRAGIGQAPGPVTVAERKIEQRERARQRYRGGKLAHLLTRGSLTEAQHDGIATWIADWRLGQSGRASALANDSGTGGSPDMMAWMLARAEAGNRFARARDAIGQGLAELAFRVGAMDVEPSRIAVERTARHGRPCSANAVVEVLRMAGDDLADFYRCAR